MTKQPAETRAGFICNMKDLLEYFGADTPNSLNRCIYKDTDCGASISLYLPDGTAVHNGSSKWHELTEHTPIRGFTIQTIVEGSEATVDSSEFVVPVRKSEVKNWIAYMEAEVTRLWDGVSLRAATEKLGLPYYEHSGKALPDEHIVRYYILVIEPDADGSFAFSKWTDSGEGPFDTFDEAETFGKAEVGARYIIVAEVER